MGRVKIGVIGCGTISEEYLKNLCKSKVVEIAACADMYIDKANEAARKYGIPVACTTEELLQNKDIEIILNLTIPKAHKDINLAALSAGKHVYCEKPFAISVEDAKETIEFARKQGLRIGSAPDTILGAGIQTAKKVIDDGWIGKPLSGTVNFYCCGHEVWHPAPEFLYKKGAGPIWDTGIYYISALVLLLGSIKSVTCFSTQSASQRVIRSEPLKGKLIDIEVPTHYSGVLEFTSGAIVTFTSSYDIWASHLPGFEIYGSEGSLIVPNPIHFTGAVKVARGEDILNSIKDLEGVLKIVRLQSEENNECFRDIPLPYETQGMNLRGLGIENMALGLKEQREYITNERFAYHVIEVMESIDTASEQCVVVRLNSSVDSSRSLPLGTGFFPN